MRCGRNRDHRLRNGSIQDATDAIGLIEAGIIRPPIAGRFP
jgi:hypothetical protein